MAESEEAREVFRGDPSFPTDEELARIEREVEEEFRRLTDPSPARVWNPRAGCGKTAPTVEARPGRPGPTARPGKAPRPMKVHEYQAKDLLKAAGVAVPDGIVATTPDEAAEAFDKLGGGLIVVKAQVHAGGRGKGIAIGPDDDRGEALEIASGLKPRKEGMAKGVQLVRSKEDAKRAASRAARQDPGHLPDRRRRAR